MEIMKLDVRLDSAVRMRKEADRSSSEERVRGRKALGAQSISEKQSVAKFCVPRVVCVITSGMHKRDFDKGWKRCEDRIVSTAFCSKLSGAFFLGICIFIFVGCKPPEPDIRLYVLDGGRLEGDLVNFAQGEEYAGRKLLLADAAFLIRHPDGDLLWDTGIDDAIHDPGSEAARNRPTMSLPLTLESQLAELGMRTTDIEYLSLSHSHWDHCANANLFSTATFIVNKDERAHMFSERAKQNAAYQSYNQLENAKTIEFDGDYDVFGDGTVKILAMPGHTPGHAALLLQLPHEDPLLLSGDLYHLLEARVRRTVPRWNTDVDTTLTSMDRFEALATALGARVIIQHSLSTFETLPRIPDYFGNPDRDKPSLRNEYEAQIRNLTDKADRLSEQGLSAAVIAQAVHAERRALSIDYINRNDPESRQTIYERNLHTFGDKLGPTLDFLREQGASWEGIIESAAHPESWELAETQ